MRLASSAYRTCSYPARPSHISPHIPRGPGPCCHRPRSASSSVDEKLKKSEEAANASPSNVYSPEKDPMVGLSEAEKDQVRQDIRKQSQRMFAYAYGIIGGGMAIAGAFITYKALSPRPRASLPTNP
ncbi:hypothetical protein SeLEV6574_g01434 [Synchytrium endobioticum]|nr:hypothetical protein SeLEV6574_g01434 [Synchytrium endobioticum]